MSATRPAVAKWCTRSRATALRVGGRYELAMARPNGVVHRVHGVYREIDPPRRLVYTWQWATIVDFPETIVTVEFRPRADGGTDLVLVHDRLPDDAAGERHTHGWTECLGKLAALVDGHATSSPAARRP